MSITPDELDAFRDNFKFIGEELDGLKKTLGSESGDGLARERRQAARERRLLADDIRSSQNINAQAAEHLLNIESGIKEAQATFKALVESANAEILQKERSAKTSTQLLQTRQADVEEQLANVTQQLQELTSRVGELDSNRQRNAQHMDQVEGRLKQLLDDAAFRKELREIAIKEAGNADEALMMAIAQKAIRQALDSGVIPPQLQPKPERPTVEGD